MSVYSIRRRVSSAEADQYRRLRTSALFGLLQLVSVEHCEALGVGRARTLDRGFLWVVTMQDVWIRRMPRYEEEMDIETWTGRTQHSLFPRYYRVSDVDGDMLAQGSAIWTLVDSGSRRMLSADTCGIFVPAETEREALPLPYPILCGQTERVRSFTVPYSYVDMNGHMSNVRYFDVAEDLLGAASRGLEPQRVSAEYVSELTEGDTLELYVGHREGACIVLGKSNREHFRMRLAYAGGERKDD
ncbi:MAG: thioesterase [Lachnospiraceae bacterium]|nr:thioesterase [Lachnospiraceae bacterium]